MPVEIDLSGSNISGLPNKLEVKNAAEEATLQELLDLFKKTNKVEEAQLKALNKLAKIKDKAKDDKPDPKKQAAEKQETQSALNVAKANMQSATVSQRLGQSLGSMARSAGVVTKGVTNFGYAAANAAKEVLEITAAASQMVGEFARMQDSITAATSSLRRIPFFGTALAGALGPAADAAERTYQEFTKLSMSGATFGGSFNDMINAATGAGLTMEQFGRIVTQNGQAMMALGGTTEQGAKRFAQMGKEMRQSQIGTELLRLGFTTEEVNNGMASYINVIKGTGKAQNLSTAELADQSGRYMKNLQVLAKMTGETVEQKKKEAEQLAKDVQLKAAIQDLSAEEQTQMINMINSYPEAHRGAIKDMIATGSVTTEEGRKFANMYPKAAADFRSYNSVVKQGRAVSQQAMNQTYDAMIDEGKARFAGSRQIFQFSREFDQQGQGMMEMNERQKKSHEKSVAEQDKLAQQSGGMAEQIASFKQRIAEVSNEMTKGLLSPSALAAMQTAFMGLANFTLQFVVPALRVMFDVIGYVVDIVGSFLSPAFTVLGVMADTVFGALSLFKPVIDLAVDGIAGIAKVLGMFLIPTIIGIGAGLAIAFAPLLLKIALVTGALAVVGAVSNRIGEVVSDVADGFMDAIDAVRSYLPGWLGGISKDEANERKARRESERKERDERKKSTDAIKKETDARKTTSTDKGMDWSGPAAMLKSYGEATGSVYAENAAAEEKRIQKEIDDKKKAEMDQQKSQQKIQSLQQSIAKDKEKLEGTENARHRKAYQRRIDDKQKEIDDELKRRQKSTAKIKSEEKAAADEKIKYTINGKEVTKEEYEEQKKAMDELTGKMQGTVGSMFSQPFVAKGGGAGGGGGGAKAAGGAAGGGGGGGGGAAGGAGGGAGGGGAGIGAVSGGGKLPTVGDKQGKASPGDEEMVGDVGQFLKTPSGADLGGLESGTKQRLAGLAQEYFNATGEKIQINTAFRSYEDQMALFKKYGSPRAARPGRSKHEVGLAFDMQSAHANKAIQLGLFDKYGFHRPVSGETWHIEPVEARGGVPDNPVAPGQEVMVSNAGKAVTPDSGKPQAAKGGILTGPKSGFDATLHGTEAVVPLPDGKMIPVELSGYSTENLVSTIGELTAKLELLTGSNLIDVNQNFSESFMTEITKMADKIAVMSQEAATRGVDVGSALSIKPSQTLDELSKNMLASGGITSGAGIAGEAGPEAVVPLPDGRTIPVTIVGGGDQNAMVDLLTALNTKMDQLVFINSMLADIGNNQLKVQKNIGHPDLLVG